MAFETKESQMNQALDGAALNRLFREARSHRVWEPVALEDGKIRELHELAKWGPTSANPGRFTLYVPKVMRADGPHTRAIGKYTLPPHGGGSDCRDRRANVSCDIVGH